MKKKTIRVAHNRGSIDPERDKLIVRLYERRGYSFADLGRMLNITRERVRQLYNRAKQG